MEHSDHVQIQWQACPVCGKRNRDPEHPLCSQCNQAYSEEAANRAANLESFPNRVEWAYQMGLRTLVRIQEEHKEVSAVTWPILERAGQEINESLGRRIDPAIFHEARLKRYRKLLEDAKEVSPEVKEAAARERRLFAAICSLKTFLQDVEARQEQESGSDEEAQPVSEEEVE